MRLLFFQKNGAEQNSYMSFATAPNENFVFVQGEIGKPKSSGRNFLAFDLFRCACHRKILPAAHGRARASHIAIYWAIV
jgi:hypothetical protein